MSQQLNFEEMDYFLFAAHYIRNLQDFIGCKDRKYLGRIDSPESNRLSNLLSEMEELRPDWVERIEDRLSEYPEFQNH